MHSIFLQHAHVTGKANAAFIGARGEDTLIVWTIISVPVILFWLVVVAVAVAVRWARRTGTATGDPGNQVRIGHQSQNR
jgi:cation transporter-like permease